MLFNGLYNLLPAYLYQNDRGCVEGLGHHIHISGDLFGGGPVTEDQPWVNAVPVSAAP